MTPTNNNDAKAQPYIKSRFIEHPSEQAVLELSKYFLLGEHVIENTADDLRDMFKDAENAVVLYGTTTTGTNRCLNALENTAVVCSTIAEEYNLYSADKALLIYYSPIVNSMVMSDMDGFNIFVDRFNINTDWLWGASLNNDIPEFGALLIATNLKKRT